MNKLVDAAFGWFFNTIGRIVIASWGRYRLLFLPGTFGGTRNWIGNTRARAAFWNACRTVPAYMQFLKQQGVERPARFEDIPPMDKDNYIRQFSLESICQGGRFPERGAVIDESSGSTGTPSNWVRGPGERRATRQLIQHSARFAFGNRSFILLNAFALGPWATGMNISMSLVDQCVLKSVGPDVQKVIASLKVLGPEYRYVITGYPPFLKILVESADLDWNDYDVCAVVGGEGMSEALRGVLNQCFRQTVSSFGASDLEINIAVESDFTISLRQALLSDSDLASDLLGNESLPMIFQYDPLAYWIESDSDRNLLFTINRLDNVSPRIRYNLHDRGIVVPMRRVLDILADHDVRLDHGNPRVDLPLLFHLGRQDNTVAFYGCNINPEDIQNVILQIPELSNTTENFAIHPFEDKKANKRLEFWIELCEGAVSPTDLPEVTRTFLNKLATLNQDFRESIKMIPEDRKPELRFFAFGESPISGQDIRLKKRYIV